ncbi:uncharacterized protein [Mytilus edulis]|uniref:uncharacterized protein n=1 Tax=Mytilus edulis TaxID=6550 RepID=UPI0039F0CBF3
MYIEFCRGTPNYIRSGSKLVILGSLNRKMCAFNRYQPFIFWTNGSSECIFQKSLCSGEGQIIDKLTRTDTTCRCDYMRGYSFVIQPKNILYCVPSKEDCSCYNKQCLGGYILNKGYQCVTGSSSYNGSTTNDPSIPTKTKSTETGFVPVQHTSEESLFVNTRNPGLFSVILNREHIILLIIITVLTITTILVAGLFITILLIFCLVNRGNIDTFIYNVPRIEILH